MLELSTAYLLPAFVVAVLLYARKYWTRDPLGQFPGPKLARWTRLYRAYYDSVVGGGWLFHLQELHERYGPVVRVGRKELHFSDPKAYGDIYSSSSKMPKDEQFYDVFNFGLKQPSVFSVLDPKEHSIHKSIMGSFFSRKSVLRLEHVIQEGVDTLIAQLIQNHKSTPANMYLAFQSVSFDLITLYTFRKSPGATTYPSFRHPAVVMVDSSLSSLWKLKHVVIFRRVFESLPKWLAVRLAPASKPVMVQLEQIESLVDIALRDTNEYSSDTEPNVFYTLIRNARSEGKLKRSNKMNKDWLVSEGATLRTGGSTTVANACTIGARYLVQDDRVRSMLVRELKTAWPDKGMPMPLERLEKLPYLTAVIKESLRLSHGAASPLSRVVPNPGAVIAGHPVPPGTIVSIANPFVHMNPEIFPQPTLFRPERWIENKDSSLDRYLVAFGRGPRSCLGINLAWSELYLILGNVFRTETMVFVSATTVFSISLLSGIAWLLLKQHVERGKLPPGPPRHWLYGSEFPTSFTWLRFEEWTQQYGPIFSLKRGGTNFIVIGRYEAAMGIMEKEGANLADRPRSIAVQETLCRNMRLLMMRAGERFKKTRRAIQSQLHPRTIQAYQPLQVRNAINLVRDLVRDPDQHIGHAKRYAASLIITLTYGKPTPSTFEEPMVQQIMIFMSRFVKVARLGAYWVDSIPLLRYVPGYLTQLDTWHQEELSFYSTYVDEVKQKINTDQDILKPNFVDNLIKNQKEYNMSEQEIAFLSGGLFLAGADTTAAAISIAMMAAACFPEEQVKVQSQIDAIVGLNRAPRLSDEPLLTLVTAFILECYRWRPVTVTGFPHRATKDIIWRGYHIPKGSTVLGSHWSIGRSPDVFPDPEKFSVDRWIDESGKLRENIKSLNFGFGRRVCPGQQLANKSLFITTAYILWAFRLREAPDAPIDTQGFTQTANIHPLPFKVLFEPRVEANHLQELLKEEEISI